ncbi:hypothetical protein VCHA27O13_80022 [Vibrio chagasii]|nr:hypothetical protein VCHA27O13_80022 [Vibrio chagasii]
MVVLVKYDTIQRVTDNHQKALYIVCAMPIYTYIYAPMITWYKSFFRR